MDVVGPIEEICVVLTTNVICFSIRFVMLRIFIRCLDSIPYYVSNKNQNRANNISNSGQLTSKKSFSTFVRENIVVTNIIWAKNNIWNDAKNMGRILRHN